jgi:aspartate racemase
VTPRNSERMLGIVGGLGPESTVDYYRTLIKRWQHRSPTESYPRVIINSIDGRTAMAHMQAGEWDRVGEIVNGAIDAVAAAGAGSALIASNAGHLALDHLSRPLPIPLLHIVDPCRDAAVAAGHTRLGLIGTRFVVESSLYRDRLQPAGIATVRPTEDEVNYIHHVYVGELVPGVFRDETRDRLEQVIATMRNREGIDGVILGGTELALILTGPTAGGVPVLNTAQLHVDAGIDWLLARDD